MPCERWILLGVMVCMFAQHAKGCDPDSLYETEGQNLSQSNVL